jgi:class 3 adenylate cyclase
MSAELKRDDLDRLRPFVTGLVLDWLHNTPTTKHKRINGSLAFVDISGFTALTERLAVRGKVGAEEMSGLLNATFASLLGEAYHYGASLVKWGGDAVLLLFEDDDHASLACRASYDMRATMRRIGRLHTSRGFVQLRMSIGIHSGEFDFFLAGTRHKEMLVAGPAATKTARMEQTAEAGEIVVSPETAAAIPAECIGAATGPGLLLRAAPEHYQRSRFWIPHPEIDPGAAMDPAIRERLITSLDDSEHRQVGVAFVEVTGVDDILANHGPGAVAGALHEVMTIVQEECDRHRITLWDTDISADGYKTMLIAGAPRRTGHDEDGLVRAARAILDRYDGPVHLRVGLNHGRVFTGAFGPYFRRTWSVNGDAVNLAARVMGKAADGQLLATQAILDRVSGELQTTALEPFVVKGKTQLIHASVVHGVGPARGGPDALDDTVFVGREAELAGLRERVAEARSGYGAAVVIGGDPGIGKTALVEQALADLPTDVTVVRGYADDYSSATPYFAIGTVLRGALGIAHDATDAAVTGHVTQRLTTAAPHLLDQLPLLMAAFGIALDDTPTTAAVQEQFRPARTVTVTTELMQHLLARPTVIVLEDLHSADAASLDILAALAGAAPTRPWLLVLVGRGGPSGDVMTAVVAETLQVLPLSDDVAHAVVIENGGKGFPPHVVRSLVQRADGNPLFLRELVAATAAGQSDALPDTLEELLAAQVDDLPPQLRQVVRVAAVLGHRVDDALLTSLLGESVTAESWSALNRYVAADAAGDRVFRTKLLRDAAYEGLPYRRRIELHGQAATAIGAAMRGRRRGSLVTAQPCRVALRGRMALFVARRPPSAARPRPHRGARLLRPGSPCRAARGAPRPGRHRRASRGDG